MKLKIWVSLPSRLVWRLFAAGSISDQEVSIARLQRSLIIYRRIIRLPKKLLRHESFAGDQCTVGL